MSIRAVSKRCVRDSVRMVKQQKSDGLWYWVCPVCGWEDPV